MKIKKAGVLGEKARMLRNKDSAECLVTDSLQQQEATQYSAQINQWTICQMKAGTDSREDCHMSA